MENQKKKLRFNLFDGIVIALILVAVIGVYFIIHAKDANTAGTVPVTYTVELTYLPEGSGELIQVGDSMKDNTKNYQAGTVVSVEEVPYTAVTTDRESGTSGEVEVPGYCTLLVTLQADCTETDEEIATTDGMTLRVGLSISMSNSQVTGSGYIVNIQR